MKTQGRGSKNSPITIDDSEDEILQELFEGTTDRRGHLHLLPSGFDATGVVQRDTSLCETVAEDRYPTAPKRKRGYSDAYDAPVSGPNHFKSPALSLESRFSNPDNKKARKRRRKLERQAITMATPLKYEQWINGVNRMYPNQPPLSSSQAWFGNRGAPSLRESLPVQQSPLGGRKRFRNAPRVDTVPPHHPRQPTHTLHPQHRTTGPDASIASSSTWLSRMVLAGGPVREADARPYLGTSSVDEPTPNSVPFFSSRDHLSQLREFQSNPPQGNFAVHMPSSLPSRPPPVPVIGMKPDQDPSSKHGLFQIPPSTSQSQTSDKSKIDCYIPNPARTLVMDKLPKTRRTFDFVNSWSKSACGAYPVYLSVDVSAGKALVEFATADLARKAWGSPRLGMSLTGLKPHQLKGKPRDDLIKVWWFRVDGVGAGAGVGEIEEGEIEGDAGEKEVEVPLKKETKKERKARLLKERQAKLKNQQQSTNAAGAAVQQHSERLVTEHVMQPAISRPISPQSLPIHSTGSPARSSVAYPAMTRQLSPYSLRNQQQSMVPPSVWLGPRSTLQRDHKDLYSQPDMTSYGASSYRDSAYAIDDSESIASSRRSSSPFRLPPADLSAGRSRSLPRQTPIQEGVRNAQANKENNDMEKDSHNSKQPPILPPTLPSVKPVNNDNPPRASLPLPQLVPNMSRSSPKINILPSLPVVHSPQKRSSITQLPPTILSSNPTPRASYPASSIAPSTRTTPYGSPTPPPPTAPKAMDTAPSEPRAMKYAPKGPSYTKRSLLARQKELEERIARSKLELEKVMSVTPQTKPEPSTINEVLLPPVVTTPHSEPPLIHSQDVMNKQSTEEQLRMLVFNSQKNKVKSNTTPMTTSPNSPSSLPASLPISNTLAVSLPLASVPAPTVSADRSSLDDLAVSFITEALQTLKPGTTSPASILDPPSISNNRVALAAKQKRLEQFIAESKILMAKLTQARTKQEKENILAEMRERRLTMEEEKQTTTSSATLATTKDQHSSQPLKIQELTRWPDFNRDGGVLIVSDDEDSDADLVET